MEGREMHINRFRLQADATHNHTNWNVEKIASDELQLIQNTLEARETLNGSWSWHKVELKTGLHQNIFTRENDKNQKNLMFKVILTQE